MPSAKRFLSALGAAFFVTAVLANPIFAQPDDTNRDPENPQGVEHMSTLGMEQLRGLMQRFVATYYLSGDDMTPEEIAAIYAQRVDYFGDRRKSLRSVISDKQAYYRRWPQRSYILNFETFEVRRSGENNSKVEVSFQYEFNVRSPSRISAGLGSTELTFDVATPGGKLIRETGKVLSRRPR